MDKVNFEDAYNALLKEVELLKEQLDDTTIHLNIANDRWIRTVNEMSTLELKLRKLERK